MGFRGPKISVLTKGGEQWGRSWGTRFCGPSRHLSLGRAPFYPNDGWRVVWSFFPYTPSYGGYKYSFSHSFRTPFELNYQKGSIVSLDIKNKVEVREATEGARVWHSSRLLSWQCSLLGKIRGNPGNVNFFSRVGGTSPK